MHDKRATFVSVFLFPRIQTLTRRDSEMNVPYLLAFLFNHVKSH